MDTHSPDTQTPTPQPKSPTVSLQEDAVRPPDDGYECDVIMKGGIASGIVYPSAVEQLSKTYWFRSIGGASSGAIVAAATAAAELHRRKVPGSDAFARMRQMTGDLSRASNVAGKTQMEMLFQPTDVARPVFATLLAAATPQANAQKLTAFLVALLRNFWVYALLWLLVGSSLFVWLGVGVWHDIDSVALGLVATLGLLLAIVIVVAGAAIAPLAAFLYRGNRALNRGFMGLCTGMPAPVRGSSPSPSPSRDSALSEWLHDILNRLSGKDEENRRKSTPGNPLTFGELWKAPKPAGCTEEPRSIDLQIITTNLTQGQPYRIPFEYGRYYFDPDEMRRFFPTDVVQWMIDHPRARDPKVIVGAPDGRCDDLAPESTANVVGEEDAAFYGGKKLCKLPAPEDLPVVVAVRLSICFPILLSAVPLYAVDHSYAANRTPTAGGKIATSAAIQRPQATRCYFSDGGICSNLPLQFFDNILPNRPTFAINLRPFHEERAYDPGDQSRNISFPCTNDSPPDLIARAWPDRITGPGPLNILRFLGSILDTARNWADDMQCVLPGYRDRVVVIHLKQDEGGLNLKMGEEEVALLEARGAAAGMRLVEHFGPTPPPGVQTTWDNHRWIRLRVMLDKLQQVMVRLNKVYSLRPMTEHSFSDLLARPVTAPSPPGFPWQNEPVRAHAERLTEELFSTSTHWQPVLGDFNQNLPDPATELQIRPKL